MIYLKSSVLVNAGHVKESLLVCLSLFVQDLFKMMLDFVLLTSGIEEDIMM